MFRPEDFFDISDDIAADLFGDCAYVWQALHKLETWASALIGEGQRLNGDIMPGAHLSDRNLFIGEGARIEPGAYILGPAFIGAGAVVRHGALVRENVVMLSGSILGHASEAKNSLFLPQAAAPHFNYVGDSIIGKKANLGAGTKLSNLAITSKKDPVTSQRPTIKITIEDEEFDTKLSKMGAILGDGVQTGCNSVLNPGCLVGRHSLIYPNLSLGKGFYPPNSVIKLRQQIEIVDRQ